MDRVYCVLNKHHDQINLRNNSRFSMICVHYLIIMFDEFALKEVCCAYIMDVRLNDLVLGSSFVILK